ncbi:Fic family protein [Longibacter salinarum]|nr:Fic family protein [Longibacter salinarum]
MSDQRSGRARRVTMPCQWYEVFIPAPLPPDPPLSFSANDVQAMEEAKESLDHLAISLETTPEVHSPLRLEEAAASCRLDGLEVSTEELAATIGEDDVSDDMREAAGYVDALQYIEEQIRDGYPVTLRMLRDVHARLLPSERGRGKLPGSFRRQQTWVGGASPVEAEFVPPAPDDIMDVMGPLERFLNDQPVETTPLVKAALGSAQLHMTQPFLTANGRMSRLVVIMVLLASDLLSTAALPLSRTIEDHREEHDEALRAVRTEGAWEDWVRHLTRMISEAAERAMKS